MKKDRARVGKKNTQTVSSLEVYNFHWFRRAFLLPLLFMFTDFMLVRRSETYAYFVVFFFSFCPFVHELGTEEGKNETRRNFFCVENVKKLFSSPQLHHSHKSVSRMHFEWYFFFCFPHIRPAEGTLLRKISSTFGFRSSMSHVCAFMWQLKVLLRLCLLCTSALHFLTITSSAKVHFITLWLVFIIENRSSIPKVNCIGFYFVT